MLALIDIRESADDADSLPIFEAYSPLSERAVRRDGTIGIRIIGPGWGSSGYYGRDVLERDIPRVFPAGTQMFWNHDTPTEEMERPEGDLNRLAAVTVSDPVWLESGPRGPGMYADARPFAGYAGAIDEIGEHIGVSIRALGRHTNGEADGRQGRIIQELVAGKSVDFVTVPGAGGGIVQVFEAAPKAAKLPPPTVQSFLAEAGRVLSKANEQKLKTALEQLTAVLALLGGENTESGPSRFTEALSNNDIRQVLDDKLKNRFGGRETYVWPRDWSVQDGWVVFEISTNTDMACYRLGMTVTESDVILAEDSPTEVRAMTVYIPVGMNESALLNTEDAMSEQELKEAQDALAAREKELAESNAALAKMQEQLLLREAGEFVTAALAKVADLPDVTKARLSKALSANPPAKDGKLDEAALQTTVDAAVKEAQAEIAALLGKDGRVEGMGDGGNGEVKIEEARKRLDGALVSMGYGGANDGH